MKRKETLELENSLVNQTREKRIYGCEEVTIGFYHQGLGNEVVDFMTMDSKGIIKCYEIKVTMQDLKSAAKKSWYGNYNYLVVSNDLYQKVKNWDDYISKEIGILVGNNLESVRKCKMMDVSADCSIMLKESLLRSLYWKMEKYKDAGDLEKQKKLQQEIRKNKKEKDRYQERALEAERVINNYEKYRSYNTGKDIDLKQEAAKERRLFLKNIKG